MVRDLHTCKAPALSTKNKLTNLTCENGDNLQTQNTSRNVSVNEVF